MSATLTTHPYPAFHPPSYYMGSSASRVQWCGRTLELQKLLGLKQRPKFPPTFCCPQPLLRRSFLFSVHKQEQVCALLTRSVSPQTATLKYRLIALPSPDAKHDLVMSFSSVCTCIIQAKWWSYVTVAL